MLRVGLFGVAGSAFENALASSNRGRDEFRRLGTSTNGIENWCIRQFFTSFDRTQHESTTAHIAPPHKFHRKEQTVLEDLKERFHVFGSRNAAQQNNVAHASEPLQKQMTVPLERSAVSRFCGIDVVRCHLA
jgi:hypothetical protein